MTPEEIRALLKLRRCSIQSIAKGLGVSSPTVHRAISGAGRCRRAEEAIAKELGRRREEVFSPNKRERDA